MVSREKEIKLKVRKHKWKTVRTIDGKVKRHIYTYTVAVKRYGLFWFDLRFHVCKTVHPDERANHIVNKEDEVLFSAIFGHKGATHFHEEADAIRVKLDIITHPDKYTK